LRGLYGQSDEAGKARGRGRADARAAGAPVKIAAESLYLPMFSFMPHRAQATGYARLTQIDPIQVWINAEPRLIGFATKKLRDRDPAAFAS